MGAARLGHTFYSSGGHSSSADGSDAGFSSALCSSALCSSALRSHADCSHADCSNADCSNADRSHADRSHADRSHANRSHAHRSHADRSHADGSNADGSNADGSNADGSNADDSNADDSNADDSVGTNFNRSGSTNKHSGSHNNSAASWTAASGSSPVGDLSTQVISACEYRWRSSESCDDIRRSSDSTSTSRGRRAADNVSSTAVAQPTIEHLTRTGNRLTESSGSARSCGRSHAHYGESCPACITRKRSAEQPGGPGKTIDQQSVHKTSFYTRVRFAEIQSI